MREGLAPPDEVAAAWSRTVAASAAAAATASSVGAAASAAAGVLGFLVAPYLVAPIAFAVFLPQWRNLFLPTKRPLVRVENAMGASASDETLARAIVIASSLLGGDFSDYDAPLFHGLFGSKRELETVMRSEGGNVDLVIVDQGTARAAFTHFSGGQFSTGVHLPHPKDPRVLIPARSYDGDLLREVQAEWVEAFESLGAKRIVIGDATRVTGKLTASKADVGGEMRAAYGASHVDESTYGIGTFDPERATRNRRWLRDYPEVWSIVNARISGNQVSWRRSIKVNASFGISVDALKLWSAGLEGGYERMYDFFVEFHAKK